MTINFPRLAYQSGNDYDVFIRLAKERINTCVDICKIKRKWMQDIRNKGRLPFLQQTPPDPYDPTKKAPELTDFDELVFPIGVIGLNEVVQILYGDQLHESDDAVKLGLKIVYTLDKYVKELAIERDIKLVFSRTPAETTAERFAIADLKRYTQARLYVKGDVEYASTHLNEKSLPVYYTNGTMVTPSADIPLSKKIEIESKFFPILQGGNICHIWLNDADPDPEALMDFTLNVCKKTNLGYFTFTKDYHICK
jgi:ribonucleoside-triphosphate reductase